MRVFAHGGAGREPDDPAAHRAALDEAVAEGATRADPQAAVVATVRRLEVEPRFNAGRGSAVQSDGTVRTDAGLMTGDGAAGAACAMAGVEAAIEVAPPRESRDAPRPVAGERAVEFADAFGVPTGRDLWTATTRERWREADPPASAATRDRIEWVRDRFGGTDTVGAVATDGDRLAAATSTGGRWFALAGRVGDVPQVGAGFYATDDAAASATGHGEAIARFGLARRVVGAVADGADPRGAADRTLERFADGTDATAGVIVVDADGRTGKAHNAAAMGTASAASPGEDG